MFETFKFIRKPDFDHNPFDVIETKYKTLADLHDRFVVFADYGETCHYRVYESLAEYREHLALLPESERVFHEVIFNQPQKLKFDIDCDSEKLSRFSIPIAEKVEFTNVERADNIKDPNVGPDQDVIDLLAEMGLLLGDNEPTTETAEADEGIVKYQDILETIRGAIREAFFISYSRDYDREIICDSSGLEKGAQKYSNHIIIDGFYVSGSEQSQEIARRVYSYLPAIYKPFLDVDVYKSLQNFRSLDCHKAGSSRIKKLATDGVLSSATYITNIEGCELLPDVIDLDTKTDDVDRANTPSAKLTSCDVERVLEICKNAGLYDCHKFRRVIDSKFLFQRFRPSDCEFCQHEHTRDSVLFVTTNILGSIGSVYLQCRRYLKTYGADGKHFRKLGEFITTSPGTSVCRALERATRSEFKPPETLFARTVAGAGNIVKTIYDEPSLRPFETARTLVIHAAMKMGKTKALAEFISKHYQEGLRAPIVRFISFRQTFSDNIKEKFPDFTLYSDVKGLLHQAKLIIQVESLHRLDLRPGAEAPDLLVLDECESIFEQFDSGLLRGNFNECFAKFQYLMKYSGRVICMDAGISDRTYRILAQMRGLDGCHYHWNTHQNATDDQYYITEDKHRWYAVLYNSIDSGDKIAVPMSSLNEAKVLETNLHKRFPRLKVKLYSSESLQSEKKTHFADVNTHWAEYDVLIYTPTVSAGVSFEQKHFNKIFGYFTDQSCPVETCTQMIGRIRDVADHQFFICISALGNNLPVEIADIRENLYSRRANLGRDFSSGLLQCEYGPTGEVVYHTGDYFTIWLENTRVRNLSKNAFSRRFITIIKTTGAHVSVLDPDTFSQYADEQDVADITSEHKITRAEIIATKNTRIAAADDILPEEVLAIQDAMISQQDVTAEQKSAYDKYILRRDYKYQGEISEKFVGKYNDPRARRIYKNLSRLYSVQTAAEHPNGNQLSNDINLGPLQQIQAEERACHKQLMEAGEKFHNQDLNRRYVFDQHRYAIGLLCLAGWSSLNDTSFVGRSTIADNLRSAETEIWAGLRPACVEFGIKTPALTTYALYKADDEGLVTFMLRTINKILGIMYGATITSRKYDPGIYFISRYKHFTFDKEVSAAKKIPLIMPQAQTVKLAGQLDPGGIADQPTGFSDDWQFGLDLSI